MLRNVNALKKCVLALGRRSRAKNMLDAVRASQALICPSYVEGPSSDEAGLRAHWERAEKIHQVGMLILVFDARMCVCVCVCISVVLLLRVCWLAVQFLWHICGMPASF